MGGKMNMILVIVVMVATIGWLSGTPVSAATSGAPKACLASISTSCNITAESGTDAETAQLDQCCTALNNAIDNQKSCFCLLKPELGEESSSDSITALFTYCSINGTFDTICPTDDGSTTTTTPSDGDTSSGSSADDVPATSSTTTPSSTSSSSTTGGSNFGGSLGGKKNAGNKMATTTSLSGLLVAFLSLMIMKGI